MQIVFFFANNSVRVEPYLLIKALTQYKVDLSTLAPLFLELNRAFDYFTVVCGLFSIINNTSFCTPKEYTQQRQQIKQL